MWNVDPTLVDAAQVTRAAYAEAFERVTGVPLVYLASTAGRTDSEVFFEFFARNDVESEPGEEPLAEFLDALAEGFARRRDQLTARGRAAQGAAETLLAVSAMEDTLQTVVTGTIMPNAIAKLAAFGLDSMLDLAVGGYGSEHYPKASLIQFTRMRAGEARGVAFPEESTVYITDSVRDVEAAVIGRAAPIAVLSGSATESQLRAAGAVDVLADLTDSQSVVSAIRRATALPAR
ncbi:HAD family hydrolase [Nocardiopsis coralliicola]